MTAPATTVEIVFDETPVLSGDGFTLDDSTKGVLNNPYYVLNGHLAFVDVTADVESVSVSRGRSRQLDQYSAGTAQITLLNDSRAYDPLNTASAYYPYVIPKRYVRIKTNGISIFAGQINDWSLQYLQPQDSKVSASCSDSFSLLANQTIDAFTPDQESTGSRISTILNRPEIDFTATSVSLDTGVSTLGAFPITDNTNALSYMRQIEKSEQGFFFTSADNTLTFKDRSSVLAQTGSVAFADDGTGTCSYMTLDVETSDELIFNRVVAESPAGAEQIASDTTSISKYDTITLSMNDLLNATTGEVASLAALLLQTYKEPEVRFTGITQQMQALSSGVQNLLLGLDLTDLATVKRTYTVGSPASVTKYVTIEGISHSIAPGSHLISYRLGSLAQVGFILDSGIFGLLDVATLT